MPSGHIPVTARSGYVVCAYIRPVVTYFEHAISVAQGVEVVCALFRFYFGRERIVLFLKFENSVEEPRK